MLIKQWHWTPKCYFSALLICYALSRFIGTATRKQHTYSGLFIWYASKQAPGKSTSRVRKAEEWQLITEMGGGDAENKVARADCFSTADSAHHAHRGQQQGALSEMLTPQNPKSINAPLGTSAKKKIPFAILIPLCVHQGVKPGHPLKRPQCSADVHLRWSVHDEISATREVLLLEGVC